MPDAAGPRRRALDRARTPGNEGAYRRFHVHVMQAGSAPDPRSRALRDVLRAHPAEAGTCARVKRTAMAAAGGDRLRYMAGKDAYLTELVPRAIAWARAHA